MTILADESRSGLRLGFILALAPFPLSLLLLVVIPYIDLFILSLHEKIGRLRKWQTAGVWDRLHRELL
jgi:hypothetical protein